MHAEGLCGRAWAGLMVHVARTPSLPRREAVGRAPPRLLAMLAQRMTPHSARDSQSVAPYARAACVYECVKCPRRTSLSHILPIVSADCTRPGVHSRVFVCVCDSRHPPTPSACRIAHAVFVYACHVCASRPCSRRCVSYLVARLFSDCAAPLAPGRARLLVFLLLDACCGADGSPSPSPVGLVLHRHTGISLYPGRRSRVSVDVESRSITCTSRNPQRPTTC